MNTEITAFKFDTSNIRTVTKDDEIWFVATDIAEVLGYRDAANMVRRLDDDERGTHKTSTPSKNQHGDFGTTEQEVSVISESGLYSAILRSNRDEARPFRRWVTHEVLPSIRKKGLYESPEYVQLVTQRDEAVKIMFKAMPMLAERDASIAKADTAKTIRAANNDKGTIKSLQKRVDELENTVVDLQLISMSIALTGQIPATEVSGAVEQKLKDIQLSAEKAVNWYRKRGAILSKPVEAHFRMITEANL